jgi:hypothetical protein
MKFDTAKSQTDLQVLFESLVSLMGHLNVERV